MGQVNMNIATVECGWQSMREHFRNNSKQCVVNITTYRELESEC
jgi:hypothetical protein